MAIYCVFCRNLRVFSPKILFSKNFDRVKKMTNMRYVNRLDGTAASAVCCIMHKKHKKENEKYLLNEILQLSVTKKT